MCRLQFVLCMALTVQGFSAVAVAQDCAEQSAWRRFWTRVGLDFHRMNAWPEPFQTADRHLTKSIWIPMVAKGWQHEHTLTDYHFDAETGMLTTAGQAKIRWISTQAPSEHRTIFVVQGRSRDETETRVDLVQRATAGVLVEGPLPAVVRTNEQPRGMVFSANYQNVMWQKAESAIQSPKLPSSGGGGGGG